MCGLHRFSVIRSHVVVSCKMTQIPCIALAQMKDQYIIHAVSLGNINAPITRNRLHIVLHIVLDCCDRLCMNGYLGDIFSSFCFKGTQHRAGYRLSLMVREALATYWEHPPDLTVCTTWAPNFQGCQNNFQELDSSSCSLGHPYIAFFSFCPTKYCSRVQRE